MNKKFFSKKGIVDQFSMQIFKWMDLLYSRCNPFCVFFWAGRARGGVRKKYSFSIVITQSFSAGEWIVMAGSGI